MAKMKKESAPAPLLERVNTLVHESITGMSDEEFLEFDEKSKITIAKIKAKAADCADSVEIESVKREALHA